MNFDKYMFNCALNGLSVAKYSGDDEIKLIVERDGSPVEGYESVCFSDKSDFESWIDNVVSDDDAIYNNARALRCLIDAIKNNSSSDDSDFDYKLSISGKNGVRKLTTIFDNSSIDESILAAVRMSVTDDTDAEETASLIIDQIEKNMLCMGSIGQLVFTVNDNIIRVSNCTIGRNKSLSQTVKENGFKSIRELSAITGESEQTLHNWYKKYLWRFTLLLAAAKSEKER